MIIQDTYKNCQEWLSKIDNDKLKFFKNFEYTYHTDDIHRILNWHEYVSEFTQEEKDIVLGNIKLDINGVKERIIESLKKNPITYKKGQHYIGDYDEDGHCSPIGYLKIINYFEDLDNSKILKIATGEVDMNGGRSYLISHHNLFPLYAFNYIVYTLGKNATEFEKMIYNSGDIPDNILILYPPKVELPTEEEFEEVFIQKQKDHYSKLVTTYNSMINIIIKKFEKDSILDDKIQLMRESKIDDNWIISKLREKQIDKIL